MPSRVPHPSHHPFTKALARALRHRCRIRGGERLLIATSGGADSVALLRALAALAPRRTWQLTLAVVHVQHHLRPDSQAEGDADFVAALAQKLDLPYLRADLAPPESFVAPRSSLQHPPSPRARHAPPLPHPTSPIPHPTFPSLNLESWARRARYAALAQMALAFDAAAVLTAHHADDQLETLLMRLLRGASVRGLAGIAWRRRLTPAELADPVADPLPTSHIPHPTSHIPPPLLLRPMLAADRAASRAFLTSLGQPWREDRTNLDTSRLRAALRHNVLPALCAIRPDAPARAVALADHLRQSSALLNHAVGLAADRVSLVAGQDAIDRQSARLLQPIVLLGLLRRLLSRAGATPDRLGRRALQPIVRAARDTRGGRRAFNLGRGLQVTLTRDIITIRPATRSGGARPPASPARKSP